MALTHKSRFRTCYVSAPSGIKLDALRESLLAHGLRPLVPDELSVGTDWATEIQKQLAQVDLVIGVLDHGRQLQWVLFELGQAWALGRRIILIAPPGSDPLPFPLQRLLFLRIDLENREAIDFALDQFLLAPSRAEERATSRSKDFHPLGDMADTLLAEVDHILTSGDWRSLEATIATALRESGADVVVAGPNSDYGADLAVWSDVLEPFVGNPFLIEIKARIPGRNAAELSLHQITSYLADISQMESSAFINASYWDV